jgi:para-nitrobenzyl esterase
MPSLDEVIIKINTGELAGVCKENLYIFKGVPYASPPIGNLRWRPPQQPSGWKGIRSAFSAGPIAPQNRPNFQKTSQLVINEPQSEDCLYLNIWSPGLDNKKRPVLVWIHGGGFTLGSGSQADYSGNILAKRGNIVVITLNYRLGLLGFLNLNEITRGEIPSSGNEGLLDQISALKWIKENISFFGGDPCNVTLVGQSAGAMSIACLMSIPQARGLFHKVISQSGGANRAKPLKEALLDSYRFLDYSDLINSDVGNLRKLSVPQLLCIQQKMEAKRQGMLVFTPVIDGEILSELPIQTIKSGSAAGISLLIGTNLDECKFFNPPAHFQTMDYAELSKRCSKIVPLSEVANLIERYRTSREKLNLPANPSDIDIAIKSDYDFRIPSMKLAEAQISNHSSVFSYLFDWKSPNNSFGSCHSLEIGFVFGTYTNNQDFYGSGPSAEKLSHIIQEAWINFAHTGNPSCPSLGNWPVYGPKRYTQILGINCHLEESPFDQEITAWDNIPDSSMC